MVNSVFLRRFLILALFVSSTCRAVVPMNSSCLEPEPTRIYSYHLHILIPKYSITKAREVREKFVQRFSEILKGNCLDLFQNKDTCLFPSEESATGPYSVGQWAAFILPEHFNEVVPWMIQNRQGLDLVVHPNTGCMIEDHTRWAMWSGNKWQFDLQWFPHNSPFPWTG